MIRGFNWSIRWTLLAISVTMFALIVGLGTLTFARLTMVNRTASAILDLWLPATRDLAEVSRLSEHFRMISAVDLLAVTPAERSSEDRLLANTLSDRKTAWASYMGNPLLTDEQRRIAQEIEDTWRVFLSDTDESLVLMHEGNQDDAYAKFMETKQAFVDLRLATAKGMALNLQETARASEAAAAAYGTARVWIGAALALGLLLCVAGAGVAIFRVSRPILRMAATMKRLAAQDLSVEIEGVGRGGEIGEMAAALVVFKHNAVLLDEVHRDLERRIDERTHELRAAQDELLKKERLSAIGQITATVAHELRNPLSAIRNSAFALRQVSGADGKIERPVGRIERSIERCDRIVEELLDYTRTPVLHLEPRCLDTWLAELAQDLTQPSGAPSHGP